MKATLRLFISVCMFSLIVPLAFSQGAATGDLHVTVKDPKQAAHCICSVATGMMVQAKVENKLEILRDLEPAILRILGAKEVLV